MFIVSFLQHLRQIGVVGKFVEFFGPGVTHLSIADRATISNMCPEYGATVGFFPVDEAGLAYLRETGTSPLDHPNFPCVEWWRIMVVKSGKLQQLHDVI